MMLRDLLGNEVSEEQARALLKRKRREPTPNGYAWKPGTGPAGETCGSCKHHFRNQMAKVYHKCSLSESRWTGGRATDILVRSPACKFWEADTATTEQPISRGNGR